MALNPALTDILACPVCKGKLKYDKEGQRLLCTFDRLAYRLSNNIPVLLANEAVVLSAEECEKWRS
ncbi:MAG: Trm112 family protein [Alishewanella agri]|uniref:Trm112 family protein n=1 Tax=Alishewanella sp. WH16-1 TaxID=1651088 RepID=UPI0007090628|nr:Trm112 family protein [Alishewanella sp. WH16-1]KRS20623.1 hypothetical protein AAY72_12830 [Alishewanella sp. WH16-1]MDD4864181.1 Trm112 family protein [Alishewanella agri]OZB43609.1 MAG: hypothetical protein B7X50_00310 [Alishewanella sp. 34-51-39]